MKNLSEIPQERLNCLAKWVRNWMEEDSLNTRMDKALDEKTLEKELIDELYCAMAQRN